MTRKEIEQCYMIVAADHPKFKDTLQFMMKAAIEALPVTPFKPGDIVEWALNDEKVGLQLMVTDGIDPNIDKFSAVVLKSWGSPGYNVGTHSDGWITKNYKLKP